MDASEFKLIDIGYILPTGKTIGFQVDESLRIVSMEPNAVTQFLFCVYDQIYFINGIRPSTSFEAMELLSRNDMEIKVTICRSKYILPIPQERQNHLGLERKRGYCYFLAVLQRHTLMYNIGLSIADLGKTHFVARLDRGLAKKVLQLGDFLHDVEKHRGSSMSKSEFKRCLVHYLEKYQKCSIVVERAEDLETRVMLMNKLHLKAPEIIRDPQMPLDAQNIASRQIQYHQSIKGIAPKSILLPVSRISKVSKSPRKRRPSAIEETSDTVTDKTTVTEEDDAPKTASPTPNNNTVAAAAMNNNDTVGTRTIAEEESDTEPRRVSWHPENILHEIGTDARGPLQKVASRVSPTPTSSSSSNQSSRSYSSRIPGTSTYRPPQNQQYQTREELQREAAERARDYMYAKK